MFNSRDYVGCVCVYIIIAVVIFRATKFHGPRTEYIHILVTPIATVKVHVHDICRS